MAGRSALTWPFASTAWPNQPIGTGAVYVDAKLPARTGHIAVKPQEIPMGMDQNLTAIEIYKNGGQTGNRCVQGTSFSPKITIPFNQNLIVPSSSINYPPAFLGADGATRYEGGNFGHCTNGQNPCAGHFGNYSVITGDALGGGSGGSKVSTLGGTIRFGEFTNGTNGVTATVGGYTFPTIRHCLRMDLRTTDLSIGPDGKGYRFPAQSADSGYNVPTDPNYYSSTVLACVEGSLFAIPQSVNLNTLGLTTKPAKQLAWTLQNFGIRPCNTQHGSVWAIATEFSVASSGYAGGRVACADGSTTSDEFFGLFGFPMVDSPTGAFGADMNILIQKLQVVNNDSATNIGGGGTPLTTVAPGFGGGGGLGPPFLQQVNGQTSAASSTLVVQNALTATNSVLSLLVGARAPSGVATPAQVGASWTNTAQSGTANTTVVLAAHSVTAGNYVTVAISNRVATTATSVASVSDGVNTYARLTGAQGFTASNDMVLEVWGAHVTTTTSITITATYGSAGAGGAVASEWSGLSESLDITVVSANGTGTPLGPLSSGPTATAGDLVIAAYAATGTPTLSGSAFSPAGTTINVPDLSVTATGADNHLLGTSEILSGSSGNAQSFSATISGRWSMLLLCLSPASSGGSAPTVSIAGGGTWTSRYSVNSPSGLGNSSAWDLVPSGNVAASGITITSTSSTGSIEYEFYEIANCVFQAQAHATGTSNAPTTMLTPTATTDVQVGCVFVPNISSTVTGTSVTTWTNDSVTQGLATNANSQIVSGANVAASASAQTYSATLTSAPPWVAGIVNYSLASVPVQVAQPSIAAGDLQVAVNWVTPSSPGGALTSYTAKVYSGVAADGTGGSLANTITGIAVADYSITPYVIGSLTSGVRYSVSIIAVNGSGSSTESVRSVGATVLHPTTVPGTPVAPACVVGDTQVTVTITPPSTGGVPISGYTFNCYNPDTTLNSTQTQLSTVFTFSGLTDGTTYGFTGIAINGNGNSAESAKTFATPVGAPDTPAAPACTPGNSMVTVVVTPPNSNGSAVATYTFNCYTATFTLQATITQSNPTAVFNSLANGTAYFFTALATNAVGTSSESAATVSVPVGPPAPPVGGQNVQSGTTYQYIYRGKTSNQLYHFAPSAVPGALLDQYGNLLEYGSYNGETLVFCSQAGEVRRSVKGTNPTDPYGFGISVSPWESNV